MTLLHNQKIHYKIRVMLSRKRRGKNNGTTSVLCVYFTQFMRETHRNIFKDSPHSTVLYDDALTCYG